MSDSPAKVGLSRRQFVQAGGALLFAAECPITFASKANATGGTQARSTGGRPTFTIAKAVSYCGQNNRARAV